MTADVYDDYFAAEPAIVARLRDEVAVLRGVYSGVDLPNLEGPANPQAAAHPAAHVFYAGDRVTKALGDATAFEQLWGVGLIVVDAGGGERARAHAGKLIPQIHHALVGWDAGVIGLKQFSRASIASVPRYYAGGKVIFPLFYSAKVIA